MKLSRSKFLLRKFELKENDKKISIDNIVESVYNQSSKKTFKIMHNHNNNHHQSQVSHVLNFKTNRSKLYFKEDEPSNYFRNNLKDYSNNSMICEKSKINKDIQFINPFIEESCDWTSIFEKSPKKEAETTKDINKVNKRIKKRTLIQEFLGDKRSTKNKIINKKVVNNDIIREKNITQTHNNYITILLDQSSKNTLKRSKRRRRRRKKKWRRVSEEKIKHSTIELKKNDEILSFPCYPENSNILKFFNSNKKNLLNNTEFDFDCQTDDELIKSTIKTCLKNLKLGIKKSKKLIKKGVTN